jgi:anti-sigma factor RsiW
MCSDIEEKLLEYDTSSADERSVMDSHLSGCEACRALRDALNQVDHWLDREWASMEPSPAFDLVVRSRIHASYDSVRKTPVLPAVLDSLAYASLVVALLATAASLFPDAASQLVKMARNSSTTGAAIIGLIIIIGFTIRVYADLGADDARS